MEQISRTGIRSALLGAALLAPLLFAGCSVAVTDPAARASSPAPSSSSEAPDSTPPASEASPAPQAEPSAVVDAQTKEKLDRTRLRELVTQNLSCTDGSATVGRDLDGMIVEFTGNCKEVTILASAGVVLLPDVGLLSIKGDAENVVVASAEKIVFDKSADINLVGGESGTPAIDYAGTANVTTPVS
ncbi:hypothetical protein [Microbacterium oleivorans]|uniref:hypothetical protein n=1 Tax=Microbacterium oleivorans TaxID=273677 RepID=UPI000975EDA0|nr:hypothetical protein [Microbacterium oleivorans]